MASRLQLQTELEELLGSKNVYFQPPARMNYPAIKYSLGGFSNNHANNGLYKSMTSYTVTLIDRNPESVFVNKLLSLPYCSFSTAYTSDNLNHFVFTLYY